VIAIVIGHAHALQQFTRAASRSRRGTAESMNVYERSGLRYQLSAISYSFAQVQPAGFDRMSFDRNQLRRIIFAPVLLFDAFPTHCCRTGGTGPPRLSHSAPSALDVDPVFAYFVWLIMEADCGQGRVVR
jgi:hypothetical protein